MNKTITCIRSGLLVLTGAALLHPARLVSQETMTLEEAVSRTLEQSPLLAQSEQQVANAELGRRSAWGSFLPSLSASAGGSLRSTERFDAATDRIVSGSSDSFNAGLSARYDVFTGGRRGAELDRTDAEVDAAAARLSDQRFAVILQTKSAFFGALRQMELAEVAARRLDQAEQSLALTRRQAQLGVATVSDTLRARLEMVNARQAVLQAQTGSRAAQMALGRQVGLPQPVVPTPPASVSPGPLTLGDEEILVLAESSSPGVVAAEAGTLASRAAESAARTAYFPSVSLSSGYSWANQAASFGGGNTSWSLGLSGSYPIFNGFQREATVARAAQVTRVARLQEQDARLAARQEADAALQALRTAEQAVLIAGEGVTVAAEDLRVMEERYRVGVARVIDFLTSQIALDQARVDQVTARYDYLVAKAELEAILGREL